MPVDLARRFSKGAPFWQNPTRLPPTLLSRRRRTDRWEVVVDPVRSEKVAYAPARCSFDLACGELAKEEIETVLRFHILLTDTKLREQFSEQIRSSMHAHKLAVDKIFQRIFLRRVPDRRRKKYLSMNRPVRRNVCSSSSRPCSAAFRSALP